MNGGYYEPEPRLEVQSRHEQHLPSEVFPIEALDASVTYLLPHEHALLMAIMEQLSAKQEELGMHLGDAMTQASETFHDNAPQEAVCNEAVVLVKRAEPVIRTLGTYRIVYYPEAECDYITLGSTARVSLNEEEFTVRVVGASWLYPDYHDDVDRMSYIAPLAQALLGKKEGEDTKTEINGKYMVIKILHLEQPFSS